MQNFITLHVILRKKLIDRYFINFKFFYEWLKTSARQLLLSSVEMHPLKKIAVPRIERTQHNVFYTLALRPVAMPAD